MKGCQQFNNRAKPCTYVQWLKIKFSVCKLNETTDFKRDLDDDSDGAQLISFGIEFHTEEAKDNRLSPCVA